MYLVTLHVDGAHVVVSVAEAVVIIPTRPRVIRLKFTSEHDAPKTRYLFQVVNVQS